VSHIPKLGDAIVSHWRCIIAFRDVHPVLTSTSPAGDAASPAGDMVASPKCGICDTAVFLTRNHFDAKSNSPSYEKNDRFDVYE